MKKIVMLIIILIAGCATTGPGGKKSFILIPKSVEVDIGKQVADDVESTEKILNNSQVQSYINNVGQKIVKVCDRKDIKYTFKVLDSEEINAFACPGGYIYIYSGLLKILDNEAQLAAVLGHEIGHVVARHSVQRLQIVYGYSILMEFALAGKLSNTARQIVDASTGLILQGYGRENEYEADNYGILYEKKAGYNPNGMIQLFEKFKKMEGKPPTYFEKLLSSHPPAQDRISNGKKQIKKIGGTNLPFYEDAFIAIRSQLP
jgi:predicted Zn-dependent protease